MANHPSNLQPQYENGCELEHHEPSESGEELIIATEAKAMANICTELLDRIFDFLDVKSLLSVADTCKRLQRVAVARFGAHFDNKYIWLYDSNYFGRRSPQGIFVNGDRIEVVGLNVCLRFLRCFGSNLLHLKVPCSDVLMVRYINQYCADTVNSMSFMHDGAFPIENFPKPFKNVEKINVSFVNLRNYLPKFVALFPKLRQLEMTNIKMNGNAVAVSFPHLTYLNLKVSSIDSNVKDDLSTNNISKLLDANRQLQTLYIRSIDVINLTDLLNMISGNPFLLNLFICQEYCRVNAVELERFVSEHPTIEVLNLRYYEFGADDAIEFIRRLNSLKLFEFRLSGQSETDRFLQQLDNKWQHSIRGIFIRLFKKE